MAVPTRVRWRFLLLFVVAAPLLLHATCTRLAPKPAGAGQPPELAAVGADPVANCCGEMRYRMIGPHRASRTKAAVGVPDQPNVFYIGVCNGGVWKSTD